MCFLIPQPIRDISYHLNESQKYQNTQTFKEEMEELKEEHDLFIVSTFARVSIAAMTVFAVAATNSFIPWAIAALCSLPATMIAAGSMCLYQGLNVLIAGVAASALSTVAASFLLIAIGWIALNNYMEIKRLGVLESYFLKPAPAIDHEPL